MDTDPVWRALASPHRRTLLDLLRNGPKTTGELSREMSALSRFAVMQHLSVLEEAKLVLFRKEGRKRLNFANPVPLREIYERWVNPPASSAAEMDLHLRRYAEKKDEEKQALSEIPFRLVKIETETKINAPREKVYAAFFEEYDNWWPHRYKPDSICSSEEKPGGFMFEHFSNGGGAITGTVLYVDRPNKFIGSGPSSLLRGINSYSESTFADDGSGGTIMKRSMELWGNLSEEMEKMFREGSIQFLESSLRGYLERDVRYLAVTE